MLTSLATAAPVRPAYAAFEARVSRVNGLSPSFVRVTFTGAELEHFGTAGFDQRIKVVLPQPGAEPGAEFANFPRGEDWYRQWRELDPADRNPFRTYTVRAVRPESSEVDVDFVRHGDEGPASRWAGRVRVGDEVVLVGPDGRSPDHHVGIDWRPGTVSRVLLCGDETAAPAIAAILERLPAHLTGAAFIEVPHASDVLDLVAPAGVEVAFLARENAPHGARLDAAARAWLESDRPAGTVTLDTDTIAVLDSIGADGVGPGDALLWDVPAGRAADGELYAWLAGEASVITGLRRHLVQGLGIDRRSVAFMGYWRAGRAELS
ncbi:siderophore-interacting protein [Agromyces seonyuensis]|uniref:Siderophore-interacting protein n=1 Tax=Agromyces seonyuensis TaxID=2662446 RepID=A0A6I4P240_9MICO|nr:siderophore-interacting protein [Agromyces seonyuensis]MWB98815.1 siderophore-interacting protein [Agromyces seonyuensis]